MPRDATCPGSGVVTVCVACCIGEGLELYHGLAHEEFHAKLYQQGGVRGSFEEPAQLQVLDEVIDVEKMISGLLRL